MSRASHPDRRPIGRITIRRATGSVSSYTAMVPLPEAAKSERPAERLVGIGNSDGTLHAACPTHHPKLLK
ncbi:hypothetical protein IE4803_PB00336 (plasmid) [Rhizobium etli bv. phaseoli str. IE4803]|nr:hypothetical protein IE4803_PB00336 [Rhizobium etli bv. phaseoli str. IE4803]